MNRVVRSIVVGLALASSSYALSQEAVNRLQREYQAMKPQFMQDPLNNEAAIRAKLDAISGAIGSSGANSRWKNDKNNWVAGERPQIDQAVAGATKRSVPSMNAFEKAVADYRAAAATGTASAATIKALYDAAASAFAALTNPNDIARYTPVMASISGSIIGLAQARAALSAIFDYVLDVKSDRTRSSALVRLITKKNAGGNPTETAQLRDLVSNFINAGSDNAAKDAAYTELQNYQKAADNPVVSGYGIPGWKKRARDQFDAAMKNLN